MEPKKKIILFSIVLGITGILLVFFAIGPLIKSIKNDSDEFIETKKEIILSKNKTREVEQFKKFYQKLEPDLEKVNQLFIDPEVPIDLIKFWEKTAEDSELSINISPTLSFFGFQINLTGSFPNFLKFLGKIETGFYLTEVQNLSVKKINDEKVNVVLAIKVFTK